MLEKPNPSRKLVLLVIKLGITAGLVYWLIATHRLQLSAFAVIRYGHKEILTVTVALVCQFVGLGILGLRQMIVLRYCSLPVSFGRSLGVTLIGSFFGVVLPGLVGGDVVKAVYLCDNAKDRRSQAVAAVLVDRIIGLFSLFLLGSIALVVARATGAMSFWSPLLLAAPALVGVSLLGILIVLWQGLNRIRPLEFLYRQLPVKLTNLIFALRSSLRQSKMMLVCVGLSLLNHSLVIVSFLAAAELLHDDLPRFTQFVLNPIAMVMNVVPLTPGGVGITETVFSYLYRLAGSSGGANIGLLGRMIQYVSFILSGGVSLLVTRVRR